jgi:hypothetical protein
MIDGIAPPPKTVIVIGGGAGGLLAAGRAAERGARVVLFEKTGFPGQKILVSGKTRCNLTNAKALDEFINMYGANGRFLHSAFHRFFREDLLAFLKRQGVETKVERGGRIFPASDNARDVVEALLRYIEEQNVDMRVRCRVTDIIVENRCVTGVKGKVNKTDAPFLLPAQAVILATGGATWPGTGSTGDGYAMAAALGHTIVPLRPALVPLIVEESKLAKDMQGVGLRNVRLTAFRHRAGVIDRLAAPTHDVGRGIPGKRPHSTVIESRMGEMMFTHFGIGGPVTLLMSLSIVDALAQGPVSVAIDLKPALERKQLRDRLQRDFDRFGGRHLRRILAGLLPKKMIEPFIDMTGIPADTPAHQITATQRDILAGLLKSLPFNIRSPLPMSSAIVTAGGVSLREIDPRTMASRLIRGLYFCGEVMDIDADTGGYNLQAAFSTGFLAAESACESIKSSI